VDEVLAMKLIPVSDKQVVNTITSFKRKNTSGYDDIFNKILIHYVNLISNLLLIYVILY
jgi:hypothetical protein